MYIDTSNSGISGDMFLAALLGLVSKPEKYIDEFLKIKDYLDGVKEFQVKLKQVERNGILINHLDIKIKENKHHRTSDTLQKTLGKYLEEHDFSSKASRYAIRVLETLINAERTVHGDIEGTIHLHELSSIDTLLDIIGVTRILDVLGVFDGDITIACSQLPVGGGNVKTAHGILPVPAPATLNILKNSNIPISFGPINEELVTPTGASLLINLNPITEINGFQINNISCSTGKKKFESFPNILRLIIGTLKKEDLASNSLIELKNYEEEVTVLETDVDDITGEILGNLINILYSQDALDVQIIPTVTKKSRPGNLIKVLCRPNNKEKFIKILFEELGTLGVRFYTIKRTCVDRVIKKVNVDINGIQKEVSFKISFIKIKNEKKIINIKPEFEDLKRMSDELKMPIKEIEFHIKEKIKSLFNKQN